MGARLDWLGVEHALPAKGERVLVRNDNGWFAARLTIYGWRDDMSRPVFGVTEWAYVVASGETR